MNDQMTDKNQSPPSIPRLIRTVCFPATNPSPAALEAALAALPRQGGGPAEVQLLEVLRHIPTDSLNDQRAHAGVVPQADAIGRIVELHVDDEDAAWRCAQSEAWRAVAEAIGARPLFTLDAEAHVAIEPQGAAREGGFRRWMLLARKAADREAFREAWWGRHADLVRRLPQVQLYHQHLVVRRETGEGQTVDHGALPVDGIAQIGYADEAAMNASYASDARLPLRDDGRELLGRITTVLVQARVWR